MRQVQPELLRRQGRNIYYSLADDHVMTLDREVAQHLDEEDLKVILIDRVAFVFF